MRCGVEMGRAIGDPCGPTFAAAIAAGFGIWPREFACGRGLMFVAGDPEARIACARGTAPGMLFPCIIGDCMPPWGDPARAATAAA